MRAHRTNDAHFDGYSIVVRNRLPRQCPALAEWVAANSIVGISFEIEIYRINYSERMELWCKLIMMAKQKLHTRHWVTREWETRFVSFPIELERSKKRIYIFFSEAFRHSGKTEGRLCVECLACVTFYVRCAHARHIVLGAHHLFYYVQQQAQGNYTNHTAYRAVFSFSVRHKLTRTDNGAGAAPAWVSVFAPLAWLLMLFHAHFPQEHVNVAYIL